MSCIFIRQSDILVQVGYSEPSEAEWHFLVHTSPKVHTPCECPEKNEDNLLELYLNQMSEESNYQIKEWRTHDMEG